MHNIRDAFLGHPGIGVPGLSNTIKQIIELAILLIKVASIVAFPIRTGSNTFDNALDITLAETMSCQLVEPSLVALIEVENNTSQEAGKSG